MKKYELSIILIALLAFGVAAQVGRATDTNDPIKLQSIGTNTPAVVTTDTNTVMALPYVQQALRQAWSEGAQYGVSAAIQNKTLVQMQDAAGLYKAAHFMRFGAQKGQP